MTRTPIPNCPQPETPIRERAWADGQRPEPKYSVEEARALSCELRASADNLPSVNDCNKAADMLAAYAATLRQQAERGDGAVSDEVRDSVAKIIADRIGNGMREKYYPQADAIIEAVAPLLRAPAEQGGRVDEAMVERVARAIAEDGVGRPWEDLAELAVDDLDQSDMLDYARAAIDALAQNAQGETPNKRATGVYHKFNVTRTDGSDRPGGKHEGCDYFVLDLTHDPFAKPAATAYADACEAEYPMLAADMRNRYGLHAERARVPDAMALVPRWKIERAAAIVERDGDEHGIGRDLRDMLAAPSRPEDAA